MAQPRPFVLWTVLLCVAASTAAGSDWPRGPQPIRASELARYGDMLHLSDEQRFAVEGLYENYLDEYEPLRWEIMELAVRYPRRHGASAAHEEPFLSRLPSFVGRTRALDEQLFAQVEPLLTEAQRERLPRVRRMRERSIYSNLDAVKRFIGDGIPDLAVMLHELDFPAELLDVGRPALQAYEDRLTRGLREIFEIVVRLCGDGDEIAAEALVERVRSLRETNRQTFHEIRATLPQEDARRFREEFYVHAYGGMLFTARCYIQPECEAALALPDLTPAEREGILRIRRDAAAHQDRVLEELADAADTRVIFVDQFDPRRGDPMAPHMQQHIDLLNSTMREMERRHREVSREFVELLGEEREREIRRPAEFTHRSDQTSIKACGVVANPTRLHRPTPAATTPRPRSNPLVPVPISRADMREFAILVELNDHDREILLGLHHEYEEDLNAYLREVRHAQIRLRSQSVANLPMTERDAAFAERARATQALRAEARAAVSGADARLFEAIRQELDIDEDDPRFDRVQRLRHRTRLLASSMMYRHPNFSGEFDLFPLLIRQRLSDEQWAALEEDLTHYERRMAELLEGQFNAIHTAHEPHPDGFEAFMEVMHRAEAMHDAHAAVADFNQAMIERFAQALPREIAVALLDEFYRQAYPDAYADPSSMERTFDQAAALPDLSVSARDRLAEIRSEFAAAYEDVRARIIDVCTEFEPYLILEGISIRSKPERDEAFAQVMAALNDERATVNRRAMRGLRSALTPPQLRRLTPPEVD